MRSLIDRSLEEAGFSSVHCNGNTKAAILFFKNGTSHGMLFDHPTCLCLPDKSVWFIFSLPGHPSWDFVASHPKKKSI